MAKNEIIPVEQHPAYLELEKKLAKARGSLRKVKEAAKEAYQENSIVGSIVKTAIAIPYGWLRNKTKLIDKLPGAALANGAIPDFIVGSVNLGFSMYGRKNGWSQTAVKILSDVADVAMISSGLKMGASITMFDAQAQSINDALSVAGIPTGAALPERFTPPEPQIVIKERFTWGGS